MSVPTDMVDMDVWAGPQPHYESDVPGANFPSVDLLHTHRQCKGCRRFRRCTEDGKSMELMRCKGCEIDSYCVRLLRSLLDRDLEALTLTLDVSVEGVSDSGMEVWSQGSMQVVVGAEARRTEAYG